MPTLDGLNREAAFRTAQEVPTRVHPPDPPLALGCELHTLLSAADRDIGRLAAMASILSNLDLLAAMQAWPSTHICSKLQD